MATLELVALVMSHEMVRGACWRMKAHERPNQVVRKMLRITTMFPLSKLKAYLASLNKIVIGYWGLEKVLYFHFNLNKFLPIKNVKLYLKGKIT